MDSGLKFNPKYDSLLEFVNADWLQSNILNSDENALNCMFLSFY